MSVGDDGLLELVRKLLDSDSGVREDACGTVTDWVQSFDSREAQLLSIVLSSAARLETVPYCREAQLHALCELADTGFLDPEHISVLRLIDKGSLRGSEVEYVEYLESEFF